MNTIYIHVHVYIHTYYNTYVYTYIHLHVLYICIYIYIYTNCMKSHQLYLSVSNAMTTQLGLVAYWLLVIGFTARLVTLDVMNTIPVTKHHFGVRKNVIPLQLQCGAPKIAKLVYR